jgi:pimeloyl-ACP methyl ester carboxylesterase
MGLPALVLVHGAGFAADCWEPTVDVIRSVEPELKVLTVDLPGRRNKADDLITLVSTDGSTRWCRTSRMLRSTTS